MVTSPTDAARAVAVLGVAEDRVLVEPPGVDQERFRSVLRPGPTVSGCFAPGWWTSRGYGTSPGGGVGALPRR